MRESSVFDLRSTHFSSATQPSSSESDDDLDDIDSDELEGISSDEDEEEVARKEERHVIACDEQDVFHNHECGQFPAQFGRPGRL